MFGVNNNNYFGLAKNGRKFYKDNRKFFLQKKKYVRNRRCKNVYELLFYKYDMLILNRPMTGNQPVTGLFVCIIKQYCQIIRIIFMFKTITCLKIFNL